PAVEAAFAHARRVVGHEIVAERVTLVGRAPEIVGFGLHRERHAIADAGCEWLSGPVRAYVEHEHVCAVLLAAPSGADAVLAFPRLDLVCGFLRHVLCDVRQRADRDEHAAAVGREDEVARVVAFARRCELAYHDFRRTRGFAVARLVRETNDAIHLGDVEPLRRRARRVELHAEWPRQPGREFRGARDARAVRGRLEHLDAALPRLG